MPSRSHPHKYQPLTDYLAALPVATATLTVAEIETIVGFALPPGAHYRQFWRNGRRGTFDLRPWVRAGWRVARVRLYGESPAVTFARVASGSTG
jgi:hypothetical protein